MREDNSALLQLAAKAERLASRASRESELHRIAGRLIRDPRDLDALSRSIVYGAKAEGHIFRDCLKTGTGFLLLQFAIVRVSELCWEDLWNDTHPHRFGHAWDGEDCELMSIWRENVCTLIKECHQEKLLLASDAYEYIARLIDAGASQEDAEELADWLSALRCSEPLGGGIDETA
jgi:hypothetical protein